MAEHVDARLHGKDPAAEAGSAGSYPLLCHLLDTAVVARAVWRTRVRADLQKRVASVLGVSVDDLGSILALAAGAHDLGKLNPYFQYQERMGTGAEFANELARATGLPRTPADLKYQLNASSQHPLRRHEFISHRIVSGVWAQSTDSLRGPSWLATLVGGHHGYWRDPRADGVWVGHGAGDQLIEGWTGPQAGALDLVEQAVGRGVNDLPVLDAPHAPVAFVVLSGLLTIADWLASDDVVVRNGKRHWDEVVGSPEDPYAPPDGAQRWMARREDELRAHVDAALGASAPPPRDSFNRAVLGSHTPRPLQAEALGFDKATDPGLWIAMYPTGDGKTEAALLRGAVVPDEGLFFGLPTLATTDAMETRLVALSARLGEDEVFRLVKSHQFADLIRPGDESREHVRSEDDCCDQGSPTWYTAAIRKLVAPNVVGTIDQILTGALARRHITMRLAGLANHHVVIDEVHTFDPYQTELLLELLHWWGATRTRVTLLSATLPSAHMRTMVKAYRSGILGEPSDVPVPEVDRLTAVFPSTVSVSETADGTVKVETRLPSGDVRRPQGTLVEAVSVTSRSDRVEAHVVWAGSQAAANPTSPVAIVSNVVADCTAIARRLTDDPDVGRTHDVICLHSGLVAGHRIATEATLINRAGVEAHRAGFSSEPGHRPVLVVGTQVIQASLDFDVDFMSTDLAPAPDLIQRLGRTWRFEGVLDAFRGGRLDPGTDRSLHVVTVVGPDGSPSRNGSVPYVNAALRRTHSALVDQLRRTSVVDLFSFSQQWVDAAYDKDPFQLVSELETEQNAALDEVVAEQRQKSAASISRAALWRPNHSEGLALLPRPARRKRGALWRDLVLMTQTRDDEDLMGTRYIERESIAVLAFDSRGTSSYLDPHTGAYVQFPALDVEELAERTTPEVVSLFSQWRLQVPSALVAEVETAILHTLDGRAWQPRSHLLRSVRPLDLRHLEGVADYHPRTGLTKELA